MTQEKLHSLSTVHGNLEVKSSNGTQTFDEGRSGDASQSTDVDDTIYDDNTSKTYLIGKYLGKGARARVFEAVDQNEPSNKYAIKIMTLPQGRFRRNEHSLLYTGVKAVTLDQVMQEVEIHKMMNHVNIVKLESFFHHEETFCILMEHCERNNLAYLFKKIGIIGESSSRNLLKQILDGLKYIHDLGIIHRDLKPSNIYLTNEMVLKIGDFGLADKVGSGHKRICGTPNYISPEALMEQGYTPAVDIWALGCIAYHMLAGKPPFDAENHSATYQLIRAHKYAPLNSSQAGAGARQLIHWMLSFLPEKRPTISCITNHIWMKRQPRKREARETWSHRRAYRRNTLITQKPEEISSTRTSESSEITINDVEYTRLLEKNSDCNLRVGIEASNNQSFWKCLWEKVRLKKSPSFHFLPSTLLNLRSKVNQASKNSFKEDILEDNWKDIIEEVLKVAPSANSASEKYTEVQGRDVPVYVAKWIDYSNKFGFGYQMTDGTTGVLFNDKAQICLNGNQTSVTYCISGERVAYPQNLVPAFLAAKLKLLENFKEYMETQLSCSTPKHSPTAIPPMLSDWARGERAIIFLKRHFLQVNFVADHHKLIFHKKSNVVPPTCFLYYIDNDKNIRKYDLTNIKDFGCPEYLAQYIAYVHSIL